MTPIEKADQTAAQLCNAYRLLKEISVVVRTHGNGVRLIALGIDNDLLAQLLVDAATMLRTQGASIQ